MYGEGGGAQPDKEDHVSKIVEEVVTANRSYAGSFGEKESYRCHRGGASRSSRAWMRGSILRNMPVSRKAMPT